MTSDGIARHCVSRLCTRLAPPPLDGAPVTAPLSRHSLSGLPPSRVSWTGCSPTTGVPVIRSLGPMPEGQTSGLADDTDRSVKTTDFYVSPAARTACKQARRGLSTCSRESESPPNLVRTSRVHLVRTRVKRLR